MMNDDDDDDDGDGDEMIEIIQMNLVARAAGVAVWDAAFFFSFLFFSFLFFQFMLEMVQQGSVLSCKQFDSTQKGGFSALFFPRIFFFFAMLYSHPIMSVRRDLQHNLR